MAVVTSLTAARILELAGEWTVVADKQVAVEALVEELRIFLEHNMTQVIELNEVTLPQLFQELAENSNLVNGITATELPNLQLELDYQRVQLENIQQVTIPALEQSVEDTFVNLIDRPKVYVQSEPPTNPDDEDRYLVVGDTWFDVDDDNRQRVWNGAEWTTYGVDIPDLSLTVKKFKVSTHHIY